MMTSDKTQVNLRNIVLSMLCDVQDGEKSHIVLKNYLDKYNHLEKRDRAFITVLYKGTIERQIELDYIIDSFSKTKTIKMKKVILIILRMSVYQLKYMTQVPQSAVCNEAVKLVNKRKMYGLKGFVNGVVRNISRNIEHIKYPTDKEDNLSVVYSVPKWIIAMWQEQYGYEKTEYILENIYRQPETTVRCNVTKADTEDIITNLEYNKVTVKRSHLYKDALYISDYDNLDSLDVFTKGLITVQDESSMMVGLASGVKGNDYVVDVCAAPGGKSLHISQLMNETGIVDARDLTDYKIGLIKENIKRTHAKNIKIKVWDGTTEDKSITEKADVVIADVPCSGLGVIGNKSDIKYNISKQQIFELVDIQRKILKNACSYVKKGGRLVFSTCTVNKYENDENVKWILENLPLKQASFPKNFPKQLNNNNGYLQIFPGDYNMDGFFIAVFEKK